MFWLLAIYLFLLQEAVDFFVHRFEIDVSLGHHLFHLCVVGLQLRLRFLFGCWLQQLYIGHIGGGVRGKNARR